MAREKSNMNKGIIIITQGRCHWDKNQLTFDLFDLTSDEVNPFLDASC